MIGFSLFKVLLICLFFVSISSFFLLQHPKAQPSAALISRSSHHSLGFFENETGSQTTAGHVSSFVSFINSASVFFREDAQARLDYISDQMNKTYGIQGHGFSVFQQGEEKTSDWTIFTSTGVYASVTAGVDKVLPTKSYMFLLEPAYQSGRVLLYYPTQKGSGINSTLQAVIKNIILSVETSSTCKCQSQSTRDISENISNFEGGNWNVFCNFYTFYLNAYPRSDMYIYTKPKGCHYGVYKV